MTATLLTACVLTAGLAPTGTCEYDCSSSQVIRYRAAPETVYYRQPIERPSTRRMVLSPASSVCYSPYSSAVYRPTARSHQAPVTPSPSDRTRYQAWRPVLPLLSTQPNYYVGQGIIGQPKVYVPQQPLRNFLRYLTP